MQAIRQTAGPLGPGMGTHFSAKPPTDAERDRLIAAARRDYLARHPMSHPRFTPAERKYFERVMSDPRFDAFARPELSPTERLALGLLADRRDEPLSEDARRELLAPFEKRLRLHRGLMDKLTDGQTALSPAVLSMNQWRRLTCAGGHHQHLFDLAERLILPGQYLDRHPPPGVLTRLGRRLSGLWTRWRGK